MKPLMGEFKVIGKRSYRGHEPGTKFEAALDLNAVRRAVQRGDIALLREVVPVLQPGSYRLPRGWLAQDLSPTVRNRGAERRLTR